MKDCSSPAQWQSSSTSLAPDRPSLCAPSYPSAATSGRKPVIRFRNYRPADPALLSAGVAVVLPQPALPSAAVKEAEQAELARLLATPVSDSDKSQFPTSISLQYVVLVRQQVEATAATLPKKVDWDLKRDVAARLAKLDRQTQRAIAEIVRERVRTEAQPQVHASAGAPVAQQPSAVSSSGADAHIDAVAAGLDADALLRAVAGAESAGAAADVDAEGGAV